MTETKLGDLVAGNVRAEFARRRLSASDLSSLLGVALRQAQRRLSGEVLFSLNEVERVADFLKVDLAVLFAAPEAAKEHAA